MVLFDLLRALCVCYVVCVCVCVMCGCCVCMFLLLFFVFVVDAVLLCARGLSCYCFFAQVVCFMFVLAFVSFV